MRTPSRRVHLVDIENLIGADHATASIDQIRSVLFAWLRHVGWRTGDPVIIACNPGIGLEVGLAAPGFQLRVRHGEHGAEQALLDWAPVEHIAARFDRVIIGSGDHAFALFARSLLQRGVNVHACTRDGALSRSLRFAVESPSAGPTRRPQTRTAGSAHPRSA